MRKDSKIVLWTIIGIVLLVGIGQAVNNMPPIVNYANANYAALQSQNTENSGSVNTGYTSVSVEDLLNNPAQYADHYVVVSAQITFAGFACPITGSNDGMEMIDSNGYCLSIPDNCFNPNRAYTHYEDNPNNPVYYNIYGELENSNGQYNFVCTKQI